MLTRFVLERLDDYNAQPSPSTLNYVNKTKEYIHKNYRTNFTVSDIADRFGISVGYLHNVFKAVVGSGIIEYTNNYRIGLAKQLIVSRNLPLKDIAELVGISDPAYMSRLFKKICGISYSDYKHNVSKKQNITGDD